MGGWAQMEKVSSYNIKLLTFNWWELRDRYARYPIFYEVQYYLYTMYLFL